jgi:hypothetical protein
MLIVDRNTNYFFLLDYSAGGNPISYFCGNTEHFCIVDSHIYARNIKNWAFCCVSIAAVFKQTQQNIM